VSFTAEGREGRNRVSHATLVFGEAADARVDGAAHISRPLPVAGHLGKVPSYLFVVTLASFAFRPWDLGAPPYDRVLLAFLALVTFWHMLLTRSRLPRFDPLFATFGLLTAWSVAGAAASRYDVQTWSAVAAKYAVPLVMFVIARHVLADDNASARFFRFANVFLVYLILIAVFFLAHLYPLIFPRFILDESIGLHADRARGPFLQAVANGLALNILALLGWYWWQRWRPGSKVAVLAAVALPIAILATLTRAVWLSFAVSGLVLVAFSGRGRARRIARMGLVIAAAAIVVVLSSPTLRQTVTERAEERGPIDVRFAAYQGALDMFRQRPVFGWGTNRSAYVLAEFIPGYKFANVAVHNTYVEVLLEYGMVGLSLYLASFFVLWRMGGRLPPPSVATVPGRLDGDFRLVWRAILVVYAVNGLFVVLNYQFINALVFSAAGLIRAHEVRAGRAPWRPETVPN